MIRYALGVGALACAFFVSTSAQAIPLTCVVPGPEMARMQQLCNALRQELKVRLNEWDDDQCATEVFRRGLRRVESEQTRGSGVKAMKKNLADALSDFDTNFPPQVVKGRCGDGVVDDGKPPGKLDLGEECDDGVNDGTACKSNCKLP